MSLRKLQALTSLPRLAQQKLTPLKSNRVIYRSIHQTTFLCSEAAAVAEPAKEAKPSSPTTPSKAVDEATLRRLVENILNLDFVEMNQMLKIIQVRCIVIYGGITLTFL